MQEYDVIVIGGGAAGLTAAEYLARANKRVCVIERNEAGGQLNGIAVIENYPGFARIEGPELARRMYEQALAFGAEMIAADVIRAELASPIKTIATDKGEFCCKGVVIAAGAAAARLGIKRETELIGDGVSYCSTCDGRFYKGADVLVAGGTVKAAHDARYLSQLCRKVYVAADRAPDADLSAYKNVEVIPRAEVAALNGTPLRSVTVRTPEGEREIEVSGVFVARGFTPFSAPFADQVQIDPQGFIVTDTRMRTSLPGVYAAGDIVSKSYRQVVTAAGEGATAAHFVLREL